MTAASRLATLEADLDRASTRLRLAVHRANWGDAVFFAGEAARLETELTLAKAEAIRANAEVTLSDAKKVASFV